MIGIQTKNWMRNRKEKIEEISKELSNSVITGSYTSSELERHFAFHYQGDVYKVSIHIGFFDWVYRKIVNGREIPIYECFFWEAYENAVRIYNDNLYPNEIVG